MIKRVFVAFGIILLFASASGVQATPQAVDLNKDGEVKRVIQRVLSDVNVMELIPEYEAAEFDKENNKLTVSNVSFKSLGDIVKYKKLVILGYREDRDEKNYICTEIKLLEGITTSEQADWEGIAAPGKENIMENDSEIYQGLTVSDNNQTLILDYGKIEGFRVHLSDGKKSQPVILETRKYKITELDKAKHDLVLLLKEGSKKEKDINSEKTIHLVNAFLKSLSADLITVWNIPKYTDPELGSYGVKKVSWRHVKNGHLGEILVDGVEVDFPGADKLSLKVKQVSIRDIKSLQFIKLGAAINLNPFDDRIYGEVSQMVSWISGVSINDLSAKSSGGNFSANFVFNWGQFIGLLPTEITLDGTSSISPLSDKLTDPHSPYVVMQKQIIEALKEAGVDKLALKVKVKITWDERTQKVVVSPMIYDMDDLFSLSFSASLGNVPRSMLEETDPQKLGLLFMGATAGPIILEIKDKGAQAIYEKLAKGSIEGLEGAVVPDPKVKAIFDDFVKFANSPKGALKVTFKPKGNVGIAQFVGAFALSPTAARSLLEMSSEYTK